MRYRVLPPGRRSYKARQQCCEIAQEERQPSAGRTSVVHSCNWHG